MRPRSARLIATSIALLAARTLSAAVLDQTKTIQGTAIQYKVVLPEPFDASRPYPGVLAFPGGGQTAGIAAGMIERNWRSEAERRGYIVVMPIAPNGTLYFEGSEKVFPEFLKQFMADYKILDGKFHIAGISNGGISAFHIAARNPEYFVSITGLPGYLIDPTPARLNAISKMCISMYVGELDSGWREDMEAQYKDFLAKGFKARYAVEKGQSHVMRTLEGPGSRRLFDGFDQVRAGCK